MKRAGLIIVLIGILAITVIVISSLGIRNRAVRAEQESRVQEPEKTVFVHYAGTYLILDNNKVVCTNSSEKPSDIPEITGVEFERLIYGKEAEPSDESALDYVIRVALDLEKHDISADTIAYRDRMVNVMIGDLQIQLGKDDKTDDKINDLADFIDKVMGSSGTLFMQNGNANNYGYTFRAR